MNKYRRECCKAFVWCAFLVASRFAHAVQPLSGVATVAATPAQWPETRHVEEWLAHEMQSESSVNRSEMAPAQTRAPTKRSVQSSAPGVELVALYGVGEALAADVRIGSRVHVLARSSGRQRADKHSNTGNIVAESIEGTCLRLRYRATSRRVCLDLETRNGGADAH